MMRALLAAALVLPPVALAGAIAANEAEMAGASEWRIPITGYDPRDLVRGRYVQFQYDWTLEGTPPPRGREVQLCLTGPAPEGARAELQPIDAPCEYAVHDELLTMLWQAERGDPSQLRGEIYVAEAEAPRLERQLRERPMVVVAKLTDGGRLVPLRLEPATNRGERDR